MLVVVALLLSQRACPGRWDFEVVVTEEHLTVGSPESRDGPDIQVPLSRIADVDLDITMPRVRRRISSDSVNRVRRRHGRTADTFVIVNYPRADRTRALHQELTAAWWSGALQPGALNARGVP